jgi:hypothetical protein
MLADGVLVAVGPEVAGVEATLTAPFEPEAVEDGAAPDVDVGVAIEE